MKIEALRERVYSIIANSISVEYPDAKVSYDNQPFVTPTEGEWLHASMIPGSVRRGSLGTSYVVFRTEGVINVACMTPEEAGTKNLNGICSNILNAFQDSSFRTEAGQVSTYRAEIYNRGIIEGWRTNNIQADFLYDVVVEPYTVVDPETGEETLLYRAARVTFDISDVIFIGN